MHFLAVLLPIIKSKTLMLMDILEHQPVYKLCVQAGKSPMETKWFSVAAGSHPNVPKTMVNEWHQMFKSRRTDIFDDE